SALERTPNHPLIYGALGRVWLGMAQARDDSVFLKKALEALQRAALAPGVTSEILGVYGRALLADGQVDAAERVLQQATRTYPLDHGSFLVSGDAAERLNHLEIARQALIEYLALARDDPQYVAHAMRVANLSARLNDYASAAEWLERLAAGGSIEPRLLVAL